MYACRWKTQELEELSNLFQAPQWLSYIRTWNDTFKYYASSPIRENGVVLGGKLISFLYLSLLGSIVWSTMLMKLQGQQSKQRQWTALGAKSWQHSFCAWYARGCKAKRGGSRMVLLSSAQTLEGPRIALPDFHEQSFWFRRPGIILMMLWLLIQGPHWYNVQNPSISRQKPNKNPLVCKWLESIM